MQYTETARQSLLHSNRQGMRKRSACESHAIRKKLQYESKHFEEIIFEGIILSTIRDSFIPCSASNLTWVRLCTSRYSFSLNLFPQLSWSQIHCFSWEWVCSCLFREHFCTNSLPQMEHLKGFSPVWVLMWRVRDHLLVNSLRQDGNGQCCISPSPSPSSVKEQIILKCQCANDRI